MTISGILEGKAGGETGSIYEEVWNYINSVDYDDGCISNFNFFVKDRMPSWVINNHPRFVKFIELFYQWLGCENDMAIIESIKDVDVTPDVFIKLFKDVFAEGFPDLTVKRYGIGPFDLTPSQKKAEVEVLVDFVNPSSCKVDVRNFLRFVKEMYQMKSIEEVYDYFFRVFYDSWVNISYPKVRLIRCSDAPFRGASAGTTGTPCYYYGSTAADSPCNNCWATEGNTYGLPPCPQNCSPGSPCGVYYDDEFGTISGLSKIQDSKVWQDYSYLIDSNLSWETYWPYVKNLIHPSGLYAAGNHTIWDEFDQPGTTGDIFEVETPITGFYAPYRFETEMNLRISGSGTDDVYPCGWNPYVRAAGSTYTIQHTQDSGGLWYKNEAALITAAHDPNLTPLGRTGHTGGTAATEFGLNLFQVFHHPNSWTNEVPTGMKFKDIQLGQFIYISPIDIVTGSPNDLEEGTDGCGF
jgi:hypothetical protein